MSNPLNVSIKSEIPSILLLTSALIASPFFYKHFPQRVPIHWDANGQVNGWGSPVFAAFFFPVLLLAIYLLLIFIPKFDPHAERYPDFAKSYQIIKSGIIGFLVLIYFFASFNALGFNIPIATIMPLTIGLLFILIGNYMGKLKLNWFVGARTPWTMSSETVWNKTNRLGGKLFFFGGLAMVLEIFIPTQLKFATLMLIVLIVSFTPFIYSYLAYQQEQKNKKNNS
ncbi:SdpI family protein [Candidatus Falkowbacteria bacterium]|nr:SdpI family protein [Candidatus Falkowbacteria bacterium]